MAAPYPRGRTRPQPRTVPLALRASCPPRPTAPPSVRAWPLPPFPGQSRAIRCGTLGCYDRPPCFYCPCPSTPACCAAACAWARAPWRVRSGPTSRSHIPLPGDKPSSPSSAHHIHRRAPAQRDGGRLMDPWLFVLLAFNPPRPGRSPRRCPMHTIHADGPTPLWSHPVHPPSARLRQG